MATYNIGWDKTFKAAVDLSSYQYYVMKAGSTGGEVALGVAAGGSVIGVLQNDPKATEEATVRVLGFSKVRCTSEQAASIIYYGGLVKCSSTGMGTGYNGVTACVTRLGWCSDANGLASGSGQYLEVFIQPGWLY